MRVTVLLVVSLLAAGTGTPAHGKPSVGSAGSATVSDKTALLRVNQRQREAHLEHDARAMVETLADGFVSIEDGVVSRPGRSQLMARFQAYFARVRIHEWEDVGEPLVQVSADGSLAWMAVQKRVRLTEADGRTRTTVFAWLATFEKRQGRWLQTSVTSTREPEPASPSLFAPDTAGPEPREL